MNLRKYAKPHRNPPSNNISVRQEESWGMETGESQRRTMSAERGGALRASLAGSTPSLWWSSTFLLNAFYVEARICMILVLCSCNDGVLVVVVVVVAAAAVAVVAAAAAL